MCLGPTVRTPEPKTETQKDPVYMRNTYLDGLGIGSENAGRNSLRIDRGSPVPNSSAPFLGISPNPTANPGRGRGGRRGPGPGYGDAGLGIYR